MSQPLTWSNAERADSAVCAAVLATGRWWWWVMMICGAPAAFSIWARHDLMAWCVLCAAWMLGTWWAVRVDLDARLFHDMAHSDGPLSEGVLLDASLQRVVQGRPRGGREGEPSPRSLPERVAGALRLYRRLVAWSVLQAGGGAAYLWWVS